MRRVAIFGVGLIGGSFALALRKAGFDGEITGVSSPRTIETAIRLGVIDRGVNPDDAIDSADLLYLAQPILTIIDTLAAIGSKLPPGVLVTDAGSTKSRIADQARASIPHAFFVGGHPMAGKERSGVEQAEAGLFLGRPYVLSPLNAGDENNPLFQALHDWIVRIGARPVILDPDTHDRLVAFTSHAPQLLSTALASILSDVKDAQVVAGPAVQELTRLGLSPFHVWRDIFATNPTYISEALTLLRAKLERIGESLGSDELSEEFARGAAGARKVRERTRNDNVR